MLPSDTIGGHKVFWQCRKSLRLGQKCIHYVICIGRLRKIINRTYFDGRHSRGNSAISGQHHDPTIGPPRVQRLDHIQPIAVAQTQINDRVSGRSCIRNGFPGLDTFRRFGLKPTFVHGFCQSLDESLIVIDQKQRAVRSDFGYCLFRQTCPSRNAN